MNNRIQKTVDKFNMLSYGDRVVAAVSGGADSMVLLNYLLSVRERYALTIIVAHVEHGIRDRESVDDAEFVKNYCEKNNVACHIKHINAVEGAKKNALSVEEYSRNKRYAFFDSIPCDKIATAHNLSDNAETVLFRLVRGTGLKGMCGIPPVRDRIIRPLIEISADEIRDYCRDSNIPYRVDSTNFCNDYSRNWIRNEVMPLLCRVNTCAQQSISGFSDTAAEDYAFIKKCADAAYARCSIDNMLLIQELKQLDSCISKRVIIKYFNHNNLTLDKLHLEGIYKLIFKPSRLQIKGDCYAVSNKHYLRLAKFGTEEQEADFIKEVLNINEFTAKNIDFYCDCDKIIGSVTIRSRKPGDFLHPAGRGCKKTIKKLFNEIALPVEKREAKCVVCDDIGIIGIIGICADERVKVDASTKNILSIKLPTEE